MYMDGWWLAIYSIYRLGYIIYSHYRALLLYSMNMSRVTIYSVGRVGTCDIKRGWGQRKSGISKPRLGRGRPHMHSASGSRCVRNRILQGVACGRLHIVRCSMAIWGG